MSNKVPLLKLACAYVRIEHIFLWIMVMGFFSAPIFFAQEPMQLNQECTATLGNQTVLVQQDGSFLVENVSVARSVLGVRLPQLYRVRATCMQDSEIVTGQSEFIELEPGQTTLIIDVFPIELDPIPLRIAVSAPSAQLAFGETTQLTVTAFFRDGSSTDVTSPIEGTTYVSTNPDLLSVDENGLVTGHNPAALPQEGIISILNQGNITGFGLTVLPNPNDLDADGMPNDFEDLFGLNKLVNDADGDLDNDGLSNIDEFHLGSIINNPDTDGDGILDGVDGDPLRPEKSTPDVVITSPANGVPLIEGDLILFSVDVLDDGLITSVVLSTDTGFSQQFTTGPFELEFSVPVGISQIRFDATANDSVGNIGNANFVVADIVPNPLSTVVGSVVDVDNLAVSGATVGIFGFMGMTTVDGTFSIADVPTIKGDIIINAAANINGIILPGDSSAFPPVAGGITDVQSSQGLPKLNSSLLRRKGSVLKFLIA